MQSAETIQEIIRERGRKGLPLERVYRMLFNPDLYLIAYAKLYRNDGAMTSSTTGETVDGMSMDKIQAIIEQLRHECYRWSPARRVYIPKKNGKKRPLGIPPWSDKLLQEVVRMILDAYYEPKFAQNSHGFREGRGCHTALREIRETWTGTTWFIEGDIKGCFDAIQHEVLLGILKRDIQDKRFIRLLGYMLEAGYMEEWAYHKTYSGTPQGGVVSPLLANIYLNELDQYVNNQIIPKRTKGTLRRVNPTYHRLSERMRRLRKAGKKEEARKARAELQRLPSKDTQDAGYRRLKYLRYADDFLLGFSGPKEEALEIKEEIRKFLQDHLKLELSQEKTLVTHARTERARFLNYEIQTAHVDDQRSRGGTWFTHNRRSTNGSIVLRIPRDVIEDKCRLHMSNGKTVHRKDKLEDSDFTIINTYQNTYRGLVNYYTFACNLGKLAKLKWIMEQAMTKTIARKHKTSVKKVYKKYRTKVTINGREYVALQVIVPREGKNPLVATWGGIPLRWNPKASIADKVHTIWNGRTELLQRLLAGECEFCGATAEIEVHHVRRVIPEKESSRTVPVWLQIMRARRRKTMVLCRTCHRDVTYGRTMRNRPSGVGFMWTGKISSSSRKNESAILESRMR
jgi:group II intron reverse transcriptase/maturase